MKQNEIKVGGLYTARISGKHTTVRVDAIREVPGYASGHRAVRYQTVFDVTNLTTGRTTTFRSAAKFHSEVVKEGVVDNTDKTDDASTISKLAAGLLAGKTSTVSALAAKIAANNAPVATGLTPQQQDILDTAKMIQDAMRGTVTCELKQVNGQWVLVIGAGAGTGKTYTLKQLEQILTGNGQYTAFNSKLVADSKPKFKKAACNTTHSLAFRAVGCRYKHRLGGKAVRSYEVAQRLGIDDFYVELPTSLAPPEANGKPQVRRLKAAFLAGQVTGAIKRFCQSSDSELTTKHFHKFDGLDDAGKYTNSDKVKDYLLPFAQKMWADLTDKDGSLPFSHDVYVKLWEMGTGTDRPVIAADYILLDEAQDTAPVMLSILQQQKHALLILVGDDNQQIYEWRGAVNAMASFNGAPRRLLSQSFRFGQTVADVANSVLAGLEAPTDLVMKGLETIPTRICPVANPRCYLYRTNAGAIGRLMQAMDEGKKGHLVGGTDEMIRFCRAAIDLQQNKGTTHPELGCFANWTEVQLYSKEDEGADLRLQVKLIDDFTAERIIKALENMPAEKDADLTISTAHRSKGLEWTSVRLGQDFKTSDKLDDAERRLIYVACTRAQEELDLTSCPTFCGGYSKGPEGEEQFIPGIEVKYTVAMPTQEQLDAYRAAKKEEKPVPATSAPAPVTQTPVQPVQNASTTVQGNGNAIQNTWAKGKKGDWLVRGEVGQTGSVEVFRRNGSKSTVILKRVVWQDNEIALYEV